MARVGGPIPDSYGLSLSVKCPTASEDNPISTGALLVWDFSQGYSAVPAPDGAMPDMRAKHPVTDPFTPLGVHVFGASRVEQLPYTGTAPAIGASVVSNGAGGVRAAGVDAGGAPIVNGTTVLYVDTERSIVEVLMP